MTQAMTRDRRMATYVAGPFKDPAGYESISVLDPAGYIYSLEWHEDMPAEPCMVEPLLRELEVFEKHRNDESAMAIKTQLVSFLIDVIDTGMPQRGRRRCRFKLQDLRLSAVAFLKGVVAGDSLGDKIADEDRRSC